jgi:hypothetical protein
MYNRRAWVGRTLAGAAVLMAGHPLGLLAEDKPEIRIYRRHFTVCCTQYMQYLKSKGFAVLEVTVDDLEKVKADYSIPKTLVSCHTGVCSGYVIEGHVPAELIKRVLKERPMIKGLAVIGVPNGGQGTDGGAVMQIGPNNELTPFGKKS